MKNALANHHPSKPRLEPAFTLTISLGYRRLSKATQGPNVLESTHPGTISPSGSAEPREAIQALSRPGVVFCIGQDFGGVLTS